MAFDSKKTILLEKTYLYVRASLGFQLEGTSTEKIPTNNGFYRFFVDNLQKAIGNSYVNILYDSQDLTLQCFCSDLYMDELMSSDSSAIEDVVEELKKSNSTILEFENGVSSAFESNHQDNVALNAKLEEFESGVSSALASNHEDNVSLYTLLEKNFLCNGVDDSFSVVSTKQFVNNFVGTFASQFIVPINSYDLDLSPDNFHVCYDGNSIIYKYLVKIPPVKYVSYTHCLPSSLDQVLTYSRFNVGCSNKTLEVASPGVSSLSLNRNYRLVFSNTQNYLFSFMDISCLVDVFNYLVAFSHNSKKYCSSFFSDKKLFLKGVDNLSCCFNQDFFYPFDGGYLDIKFETPIDVSSFSSLTLRIKTDVGYKDFAFSELQPHRESVDSPIIILGNFPNVVFSSIPCSVLTGIEVF